MYFEKLGMYRKGLSVERLHTVTHIKPYSNGFHSANAALIAYELCKLNDSDNSVEVVLYMLMHDLHEGYTGDIPANVKCEFEDFNTELKCIEKDWELENIPDLPQLGPFELTIAKVSDLAELGMYCLDELNLGNKNMIPVLVNVIDYLKTYQNVVGAKEFIAYFTEEGMK